MNETEQLEEMIKKLQEISAQALGLGRYQLVRKLIDSIEQVEAELSHDRLRETLSGSKK